jgi:hypothetical protein
LFTPGVSGIPSGGRERGDGARGGQGGREELDGSSEGGFDLPGKFFDPPDDTSFFGFVDGFADALWKLFRGGRGMKGKEGVGGPRRKRGQKEKGEEDRGAKRREEVEGKP